MKTEQTKDIKRNTRIIILLVLEIAIMVTISVLGTLYIINSRYSVEMKALNNIANICANNISNLLTLSNIYKFCKEKEPEGYELKVWWNDDMTRDEKLGFTCGYANKEGAYLYKYYKFDELLGLKW